MTLLVMHLLLTGLWVLMTHDTGLVNNLVGFILALGLLWWLWPQGCDRRYFRKLPAAVAFVAFFLWELVLSSVRVAHDVLTPGPRHRPAIITVPLDITSDAAISLLANLITLTPGTLAMGLTVDRRALIVHAMFAPDDEALRREIKDGFERRVKELLS